MTQISHFSKTENIDYIIVCCCGVKIIDNDTKKTNLHTLLDKAYMALDGTKDLHKNSIIHSILQLSKELLISTVSEGIETKEQMEFLKESGCNIGQGYYFSKPLPGKEFEKLLQ